MNAHRNLATRSRKFGIAVIALASFATLVACGSQDATSSAADQSPTASSSRQAGNLGTRVCINNSTRRAITLDITSADTGNGEQKLPHGARICTEGTAYSRDHDVAGIIDKSGDIPLTFDANNPTFGYPVLELASPYCMFDQNNGFKVNESKSATVPMLNMEVVRRPDGQWKNFEIYLTPGDGVTNIQTPKQCHGYPTS